MKVKIVSRILTFVGIGACARLSHRSCPAGFTHSVFQSAACSQGHLAHSFIDCRSVLDAHQVFVCVLLLRGALSGQIGELPDVHLLRSKDMGLRPRLSIGIDVPSLYGRFSCKSRLSSAMATLLTP